MFPSLILSTLNVMFQLGCQVEDRAEFQVELFYKDSSSFLVEEILKDTSNNNQVSQWKKGRIHHISVE